MAATHFLGWFLCRFSNGVIVIKSVGTTVSCLEPMINSISAFSAFPVVFMIKH